MQNKSARSSSIFPETLHVLFGCRDQIDKKR